MGAVIRREWGSAKTERLEAAKRSWSTLVFFNVWAPGWPWHGSTLSYRAGERWQRSFVRCLQGYIDHEIRRGAIERRGPPPIRGAPFLPEIGREVGGD